MSQERTTFVMLRGPIFTLGSTTMHGTYCGTVSSTDSTGGMEPAGAGDFEGDGDCAGWAYNGEWRSGKPCGTGWWRFDDGGVYAGEVRDGRRYGRGTYWSPDRRRCFEGEWRRAPVGEGVMLDVGGDLWRVRFGPDENTALWGEGWDAAEKVARLARVVAGGPAPVAVRAGGGDLPEWIATVEAADGRLLRRRFRGLTQVDLTRSPTHRIHFKRLSSLIEFSLAQLGEAEEEVLTLRGPTFTLGGPAIIDLTQVDPARHPAHCPAPTTPPGPALAL